MIIGLIFRERLVKSRPGTIENENEIRNKHNSSEKQKTILCFVNENNSLVDSRENEEDKI